MEDTTSKKVYLEWSDIHELVNIICETVKNDFPHIDTVFGLKRGGYIPAVMISHQLGLEYVNEDEVHYDTLVVDDICDSGNTLEKIKKTYNKCRILTLLTKESASVQPDIYGRTTECEWAIFPWEAYGALEKRDNTEL